MLYLGLHIILHILSHLSHRSSTRWVVHVLIGSLDEDEYLPKETELENCTWELNLALITLKPMCFALYHLALETNRSSGPVGGLPGGGNHQLPTS